MPGIGAAVGAVAGGVVGGLVATYATKKASNKIYDANMQRKCPLCQSKPENFWFTLTGPISYTIHEKEVKKMKLRVKCYLVIHTNYIQIDTIHEKEQKTNKLNVFNARDVFFSFQCF